MDFFTSKQNGVFDNVNYGTWAESSFVGETYESREHSFATSTSTLTGSGSTSESSKYSNLGQFKTRDEYDYSETTRQVSQYATGNISYNYDETRGTTIQKSRGDTTSYIDQTIGTVPGGISFTNTELGYASGISSSQGEVGLSSLTSNETGSWNSYIVSTSSYTISTSYTTSGNQTSYSDSLSQWTTINSLSIFGVSLTTTFDTDLSITYAYTTSTQGANPTVTKTNHFNSPYVDTVILANAVKDITNYNIGNQIWTFSLETVFPDGSTFGRFSELFASVETDYLVLPYKTERRVFKSFDATAITSSKNTRTVINGTGGTVTSTFTSYNGTEYSASANSKTETVTIDIGDVSTSISGTGTNTGTQFYSTSQISGYNASNSFTTGTETASAYTSSTTTAVNKFWNSAQSTELVSSRGAIENEVLYSYYLTSGTDYSFIGFKKTTTTNAYTFETTLTYPFWSSNLNPTVKKYTTVSNLTYVGGSESTGFSVGETLNATYWTVTNYSPDIWTTLNNTQENNIVVFKSPPIGYAGVGGNFAQSNLIVYESMNVGLVSGGAYGTGQTLNTENLPTVLAYDNVTIFPDSIYSTNFPSGAYAMRYISTNSALGSGLVGVTWSTTTQTAHTLKDITGGTTLTTTEKNVIKPATYSVAPANQITGDFYSTGQIVFNTSDVRGDNNFSGGYALGNNAIGSDYTVSLGLGYAEWTAYNSTGSVSSSKSQGTAGSVSFTIPSSLAIVFNAEPILSMSWAAGDYYLDAVSQSYQYFPT